MTYYNVERLVLTLESGIFIQFFFFFYTFFPFLILFIYLFLAVLGLCCYIDFSLVSVSGSSSLVAAAVISAVVEHGL